MRAAIVGFPFSGKSTVFCALSGLDPGHLKAAEEALAAVHIPEPRLELLERIYRPKKKTLATMEFVDLPGSAEGDVERAGLEKHLPTLRQVDALVFVLRDFRSDTVPAHLDRVDPRADRQLLRDEMLLADLLICTGRIEKLEKALTKPSKERDQQKHELELLRRCRACLEAERPLAGVIQPGDEERMLRSFGFLTQKRYVAVVNVGEDRLGSPPPLADPGAFEVFSVCATLEAEIMQVDAADRPAFMAEYGIAALARDRIVRACFDALGMIFFLTAGEEEVRAWAIPKGATAVEAAGKIHTDLARGFIRAETVSYEDLRAAGSMREAKAHGKVRQEPKSYVVADGDVMLIKFNV